MASQRSSSAAASYISICRTEILSSPNWLAHAAASVTRRSLRPSATTRAPFASSANANVRPRKPDAPVSTAVLPSSEKSASRWRSAEVIGIRLPVSLDEGQLVADKVHLVVVRAASNLKRQPTRIANRLDRAKHIVEVSRAHTQRPGLDPALGFPVTVLDVYRTDAVAVRRELLSRHITQPGGVAGVPVDLQHRVLNPLQKRRKLLRPKIRLKMQLDAMPLRHSQRALQDIDDHLLLVFAIHPGVVHEWQHDASRADPRRDRYQLVQMFLPPNPLRRAAADQRNIHKPVAAQSRCSNPMLLLQRIELRQTLFGKDWIGNASGIVLRFSVSIMDPLDVIQTRCPRAPKLIPPTAARKSLKTTILRRRKPSLHNAERMCGRNV